MKLDAGMIKVVKKVKRMASTGMKCKTVLFPSRSIVLPCDLRKWKNSRTFNPDYLGFDLTGCISRSRLCLAAHHENGSLGNVQKRVIYRKMDEIDLLD